MHSVHRQFACVSILGAVAVVAIGAAACSGSPPAFVGAGPVARSGFRPHTNGGAGARIAGSANMADGMQSGVTSGLGAPLAVSGWTIPTSTPVRTYPAAFGAFVVPAPTDIVIFTVDNYKAGSITAPGIAPATASNSIANWSSLSAAQQTEAEQSTVFVVTNLYASTPTLLGWSNSSTVAGNAGNHAKDVLARTWLDISFDSNNLELYLLGLNGNLFCWEVPTAQSSTGYAASQVGPLSECANWPAGGKGTSGSSVTYSAPYPTYGSGGDVYEMYWGDDTGHLNCLKTGSVTGDAGAGKAPSACSTAYTGNAHSLGATSILGPPVVFANTGENQIFIGDQYGTVYRVDDLQSPGTPTITITMYCGVTGVTGQPCAATAEPPGTTTSEYALYGGISGYGDYVYWASNGRIYQAPTTGSGPNGGWVSSDITSTALFTPTLGAPIESGIAIDDSQPAHFAYIAANDHLYKVEVPLGGAVYSSPLYRAVTAPQSLALSASTTMPVPAASWPIGLPLPYFDSVFVPSGYGNAQFSGSVGAPVSTGTLTPTLSGGIEQYGCIGSAANPFLAGVTSANYGASVETGMVVDYEAGNIYFGYDTGGASPSGGFVQHPAAAPTTAGWGCPSPTTLGSACGSTTACVGAPPAGMCVNDSDCSGSTPYCDIFPDSAFGTCVACRTDANCPQVAGSLEVCDTNDQLYACVETARCTTTAQCKNTTDDPDYNTTLTLCNTTPGPAFDLCASCVSNTSCVLSTSTPVCDTLNAGFVGFGTCVECAADSDCAANDEYANAGLLHCDTNKGSPTFDHCAACTSNSQCTGGLVCDTSTQSASTTYFDTCVACDSSSAASCGSGQVCDTVLGDANYDLCATACSPPGSSNAPANNCGATAPVCGASGSCVQCMTNAQCPGNAQDGGALGCLPSSVCQCQKASDCPGGAGAGAACQNGVCVP